MTQGRAAKAFRAVMGRVVTLRFRGELALAVRIVDGEIESGVCNHYPLCGQPDHPHVWFWARNA